MLIYNCKAGPSPTVYKTDGGMCTKDLLNCISEQKSSCKVVAYFLNVTFHRNKNSTQYKSGIMKAAVLSLLSTIRWVIITNVLLNKKSRLTPKLKAHTEGLVRSDVCACCLCLIFDGAALTQY